MSVYEPTERSRIRRKSARGSYDRELVHAILDEALVCQLGIAVDGQPYVLPNIHARVDDVVYLHGAPVSRTLTALRGGAPCCLTATIVDGIVFARSAIKHSLNFRSVVLFGNAAEVEDADEKLAALEAVVEHIAPGRWSDARSPTPAELRATSVLRLPLKEASAKLRSGPPTDFERDQALPIWAGELPLALSPSAPLTAADVPPALTPPPYVRRWART